MEVRLNPLPHAAASNQPTSCKSKGKHEEQLRYDVDFTI